MSKPINKGDSRWYYWRHEGWTNANRHRKTIKWIKRQINKARRRFNKRIPAE